MCLAQGHNEVTPVRLEPTAPWSRVKHSTTEPPRKKSVTLKLQRAWKRPYVVSGKFSDVVYKIQDSHKSKQKVVHHDRLKPYCGENTPTWFKM